MASGHSLAVKGHGSLQLGFHSQGHNVQISLAKVRYVPDLRYNRFSLKALAERGHTYSVNATGVSLMGGKLTSPAPRESVNSISAYRKPPDADANAVIAAGQDARSVNINLFQCAYGHVHEVFLRKTARTLGVFLEGDLKPCTGCSMENGLRKEIAGAVSERATKKFLRIFVDLSARTHYRCSSRM